jgi:hypothetical protein
MESASLENVSLRDPLKKAPAASLRVPQWPSMPQIFRWTPAVRGE